MKSQPLFLLSSFALILAVILILARETPAGAAPGEAVVDAALLAHGVEVYRAHYCGSCHALTAASTRGTFGPAHDDMGLVAARRIADPDYVGGATTVEEYLRESLLDPRAYIVEGYQITQHHMPAYTHLTPAEIDALVYLLAHQSP
jgi:mono/diheme cytochrome c family protein